jgi:hypothetical protein
MNPDEQQAVNELLSFLPTPTYIALSILFGVIGFVAYRFGKKTERPSTKWLGAALMFYPYLIGSSTWLLFAVGAGLCLALYILILREQ